MGIAQIMHSNPEQTQDTQAHDMNQKLVCKTVQLEETQLARKKVLIR